MDRPSIYDADSNWYADWYFTLRLEEEIVRSHHYGFDMALLWLGLGDVGVSARPELMLEMTRLEKAAFRRSDIPGALGQEEFAICLPQTDGPGGIVVADRLASELTEYVPRIGLAVYPTDGISAMELLQVAAANAVDRSLIEREPEAAATGGETCGSGETGEETISPIFEPSAETRPRRRFSSS